MLNLSDKDLDRLSREAAQEYEPGEILGPNSWEKLEIRLDSDLGHGSPNPLRHIRRFPFYYAPALLVLLGISYYYLTKHPPSSHYTAKNSITTQNPTNQANSTPSSNSTANPTAPDAASHGTDDATADAKTSADAATPGDAQTSSAAAGSTPTSSPATARSASDNTNTRPDNSNATPQNAGVASTRHNNNLSSHSGAQKNSTIYSAAQTPFPISSAPQTHPPGPTTITPQTHEPQWSRIGGLSATKTPADISDSALRAFTAKSMPPPPIKRALYIKRNWQFGLMAAPDFASVNSLAGDKPGSTIGITVDYQFAPRWYISSGLLLGRRNYAARGQDFHPSHSFYQSNGVDSNHLDFVKGSLRMLEIPLNLRYDFSVTGSTLFFASAGVSSYLLSSENGNCYVQWLNGVVPKGFNYPASGNYLFSSLNLSLGVETGLSNSLSMLIAPYLKMPLRTIGHGQLQMNSVGISFSLKWAPVTSRRRR